MTGNETDARRVLNGAGKFIGEGCTRKAYLLNGIVYKVEIGPGADYYNELEHTTANELRDNMPEHIVIPETSLYKIMDEWGDIRTILAMPYIPGNNIGECVGRIVRGVCDCADLCWSEPEEEYMITIYEDSISWGNTIVRDGKYYLIDLA